MKKEKKLKISNIIYITGIFILFLGISLIIYSFYQDKKEIEKEEIKIIQVLNQKQNIKNEKNNKIKEINNYIGVLEIPKIKLKKGLSSPNSSLNNVNKNIEIITPININEKGKNFILAAHSGTSKVSFFKNINKLNKKDKIYIYYENKKYIYEIIKKYEEEKIGKIYIENKEKQTLLTLTTCSKNKNKQLIIISKQIKIEEY